MKKRSVMLFILCVLLVLVLTGCFLSKDKKKKKTLAASATVEMESGLRDNESMNITENITTNITSNVTANITGNISANATGDVNVTADDEDNTDELDCVTEGNTIPVIAEPPECCEGLDLILPKEEMIVGIAGYCTANCGNGVCDEIESAYNCAEDCQ